MKIAILGCRCEMSVEHARRGQAVTCPHHGRVAIEKLVQPEEPRRRRLRSWQTPGSAG